MESIVVVGGLVCVLWATLMPNGAEASRAVPTASPPRVAAEAVSESDEQRRLRLNARLAAMVRNGEGARLTDARAQSRSVRVPASRPSSRTRNATIKAPIIPTRAVERVEAGTDISTITPPAYRGGPVPVSGRGYTPPRLDLVTSPKIPENDIECLTQAIYYEARNESEDGQSAVAEVVINRSRAGSYPRRICDVVYQRNSRTCQFTFTCDGSIGRSPVQMRAWARAERIAREVYDGKTRSLLPPTSVNYHANYVRPSWGRRLERVRQIGAHIFYGAALNGHSTPGSQEAKPDSKRAGELQFVRIEALDRAYESLFASEAPASPTP